MDPLKTPIYFILCLLAFSCKPSYEEPQISLSDYKIEEGFDLEVVASEPLLKAPVAMDFDTKGRIWVADMPGFMSTIEGQEENLPTGSIKILEDRDKDGVMDHAITFLDSLVMPRALALVYGGLLYAEPPNLWFVDIKNDRPENRVLVDSLYATDGNPEHQPNGLMLNLDNWIYNAKLNFRYQRKNGVWIKEPTTFRGQWGITHDNFGRLYYNDNSRQLLGDHILPNRMIRNRYYVPRIGVNQLMTGNQRVYPLHATSVNRGYAEGILNKDSLLINVTAACGPLIYRGGAFPEGYQQNAFVCVPEANLIKRNILYFEGDHVRAEQAWEGKEFLASSDEGFRPVNLKNGPEGSLYIVDMHRGVIEHHAYLTAYLKKQALEKRLDTLVDYGRILKVKNKEAPKQEFPDIEQLSASELVNLLKQDNGWLRDRAQHYLIFKNQRKAIPELKALALDLTHPLAQVHALYALKGLEALSFTILDQVAQNSNPEVASHALVLMDDFVAMKNSAAAEKLFENLLAKNNLGVDLYLSSVIGSWMQLSRENFSPIAYALADRHKESKIYSEALVSGMEKGSADFLSGLKRQSNFKNMDLESQLAKSMERQQEQKQNPIFTRTTQTQDTRTKGSKLFHQICAACHASTGEGIDGLAPPLLNSEYVSASKEQLGLIILHGLKDSVHVNGEVYQFNHVMPGLLDNEAISDQDITDIISYITNAFSDAPKNLSPMKVQELRNKKSKSGAEYTEEELRVLYP